MGNTLSSTSDAQQQQNETISKQPNTKQKNEPISIPKEFIDPMTNKIMAEPTMVLSSMKIYDKLTIKKWLETKRYYDPITGIPMHIGQLPALLLPRCDIQDKINYFTMKYPKYKSNILTKDDESIKWKAIFQKFEQKIIEKHQQIINEQRLLQRKAKQIFAPFRILTEDEVNEMKDNDDYIGVKYDKSIILDPNIPIICIMGPSRNGKSTIVNDILSVKDACKVGVEPNVAMTKGGWIAKYSTKVHHDPQQDEEENKLEGIKEYKVQDDGEEFYLLDMEGLSHDVTRFTKRLFYACYAISNVVVWNDKEVGSGRFISLMKELKEEMKAIATSDRKPSFIYLKRDAGDFIYKKHKTLDVYINNDKSFEWFRNMNIFSSISGYQLQRPAYNEEDDDEPLNFSTLDSNRKLLTPLIDKLVSTSKTSTRFCSDVSILKRQINDINKLATLFNEEINKLKTSADPSKISKYVISRITLVKNEIVERIRNKTNNDNYSEQLAPPAALSVGIAGACLMAGPAVPVAAVIFAGVGGAGLGYLGGYGIGKAVEDAKVKHDWYDEGYMKYELGKTDEEIQLGKENALDNKQVIDKWTNEEWNYWNPLTFE